MHQWSLRILITSAAILCCTQALALDGYRDRRGIFYGVGFGGGQTKTDVSGAKGRLGHNLKLRIGGGVSQTGQGRSSPQCAWSVPLRTSTGRASSSPAAA